MRVVTFALIIAGGLLAVGPGAAIILGYAIWGALLLAGIAIVVAAGMLVMYLRDRFSSPDFDTRG